MPFPRLNHTGPKQFLFQGQTCIPSTQRAPCSFSIITTTTTSNLSHDWMFFVRTQSININSSKICFY